MSCFGLGGFEKNTRGGGWGYHNLTAGCLNALEHYLFLYDVVNFKKHISSSVRKYAIIYAFKNKQIKKLSSSKMGKISMLNYEACSTMA